MWTDDAGAAGVEAGEAAAAAEVRATGTGSTGDGTASQPVSAFDLIILFIGQCHCFFLCCIHLYQRSKLTMEDFKEVNKALKVICDDGALLLLIL